VSTYTGWRGRVAVASAPIGDRRKAVPTQCTAEWTPERDALLLKLWRDGWSSSAIAERLGGTTRNAVIGKIARHRDGGAKDLRRTSNVITLGGTKKQRASRTRAYRKAGLTTAEIIERARARNARREARIYEIAEAQSLPDLVVPEAERIPDIRELPEDNCKWPLGPAPYHWHRCKRLPGKPYCEFHTLRSAGVPVAKPGSHILAYPSRPNGTVHAVSVEFDAMEPA